MESRGIGIDAYQKIINIVIISQRDGAHILARNEKARLLRRGNTYIRPTLVLAMALKAC